MPKVRLKRFFKWVFIGFCSLFLLDAIFVVSIAHIRPNISRADAIIVLGAAINTPALYNRSLEGLKLYEQGKAPVMVLSGGRISAKYISEATYMERVMESNTSTPLNLLLEENSHSTYDNIVNSKARLPNAKSIIIVSDEFHLARAVLVALRNGFYPVYWSAPKPTYFSWHELLFYYIREIFALIAYVPKFIFN